MSARRRSTPASPATGPDAVEVATELGTEPPAQPPTPTSELMERGLPYVLNHFGISDWDILMVGDGSGFDWKIGAGWACTLVDQHTLMRKVTWGAWSTGKISIAELMPYIHTLSWYEEVFGRERRRTLMKPTLSVHIICDNQVVVEQGNMRCKRGESMIPWWACWAAILRRGYRAQFHWIPGHDRGNQVGLNVFADHVSRQARTLIEANVPEEALPGISAYHVNPN